MSYSILHVGISPNQSNSSFLMHSSQTCHMLCLPRTFLEQTNSHKEPTNSLCQTWISGTKEVSNKRSTDVWWIKSGYLVDICWHDIVYEWQINNGISRCGYSVPYMDTIGYTQHGTLNRQVIHGSWSQSWFVLLSRYWSLPLYSPGQSIAFGPEIILPLNLPIQMTFDIHNPIRVPFRTACWFFF